MTNWNLAEIFTAVASRVPDRPCQIQGDRVVSWREFDRRAESLAADLLVNCVSQRGTLACRSANSPVP